MFASAAHRLVHAPIVPYYATIAAATAASTFRSCSCAAFTTSFRKPVAAICHTPTPTRIAHISRLSTNSALMSRSMSTEKPSIGLASTVASNKSSDSSSSSSDDSSAAIEASQRFWWSIGGLSGGLGVALGAFGAHGLKARVTDVYYLDIWNTASQYQMYHALAIIAAPIIVSSLRRYREKTGLTVWAGLLHNLGLRASPSTSSSSSVTSSSSSSSKKSSSRSSLAKNYSARAFLFGTIFFSGSLYALTLTENKKWGAVTPIGGFGFIAGWILLVLGL